MPSCAAESGEASPLSDGATPLSATVLFSGTTPPSHEKTPLSCGTTPLSDESRLLSRGARLLSGEATPLSDENPLLSDPTKPGSGEMNFSYAAKPRKPSSHTRSGRTKSAHLF